VPGTIDNGSRSGVMLPDPSGGEQRILLCGKTTISGRGWTRATTTAADRDIPGSTGPTGTGRPVRRLRDHEKLRAFRPALAAPGSSWAART
jgi:hypothetical protein